MENCSVTIDELTEENRRKADVVAGRFRKSLLAVSEAALQASITAWPETLSILADTERALKRATKRAAVPASHERVEFKQHRGPTIEFTGRRIAQHEFETRGRDPMHVAFEIWETMAGNLVAVTITAPSMRDGFEIVEATVVERQDDVQAMRFAVMEHFDWNDGARNMARKLGWSIRVEVE